MRSDLLCPEQDSNLHTSRHAHLKRTRLPIPPSGRACINTSRDSRHAARLRLCIVLRFSVCKTAFYIPRFVGPFFVVRQKKRSGKRDSNSRPRPWQGRALPTELFPQNFLLKLLSKRSLAFVLSRGKNSFISESGCKSTAFF